MVKARRREAKVAIDPLRMLWSWAQQKKKTNQLKVLGAGRSRDKDVGTGLLDFEAKP